MSTLQYLYVDQQGLVAHLTGRTHDTYHANIYIGMTDGQFVKTLRDLADKVETSTARESTEYAKLPKHSGH